MEHDEKLDTKNKIMEAALSLFAEKGLDGTSIRDIAKKAEVNLAAVNYHFSTKDNLFMEVIFRGRKRVTDQIVLKLEKAASTEDLVIEIFDLFHSLGRELVSHFKMLLSFDFSQCISEEKQKDIIGPPGGVEVVRFVEKEIGRSLTQAEAKWVTHIIFFQVVHSVLIENTSCSHIMKRNNMWDIGEVKQGIRKLVCLMLADLKKKK